MTTSAKTWAASGLGTAAGIAGAYWLLMSPYSQASGPFPFRGDTSERVVALTFDDGPNEPFTSQIADFLDERGIKATFFQVGRAVLRCPETTARLVARGHVIGHHGHTHEFSQYLRRRRLSQDIDAGQRAFVEQGLRPALYRPPWLLRIPALHGICRQRGLQLVSGVFCHPLEVFQPSPRRIARRALRTVRPGSILIFHDGFDGRGGNRANTVAAVKLVVDQLIQRDFRFVTVDRLLGLPAYSEAAVAI